MPVSLSGVATHMHQVSRCIVTGATGFVGRALERALQHEVTPIHLGIDGWRERIARASWQEATVFHLAARVHRMQDGDEDAYERDNVGKTRAVAQAAAAGGARRIVFLSTIKVLGEESGLPFRADDEPHPPDAYARSKWRAEQELRACAAHSPLEAVIVRAPLVIGASAQGNLQALLRLADSGWPLPLAAVRNRRTFVAVEDLAALLARCADANVAGRTLMAGDPDAVSTPRLLRVLRGALGRPARLFAAPPRWLEAAAAAGGRAAAMRRLTRSLEVDVAATMEATGWRPSRPIDDALADMARAWKRSA